MFVSSISISVSSSIHVTSIHRCWDRSSSSDSKSIFSIPMPSFANSTHTHPSSSPLYYRPFSFLLQSIVYWSPHRMSTLVSTAPNGWHTSRSVSVQGRWQCTSVIFWLWWICKSCFPGSSFVFTAVPSDTENSSRIRHWWSILPFSWSWLFSRSSLSRMFDNFAPSHAIKGNRFDRWTRKISNYFVVCSFKMWSIFSSMCLSVSTWFMNQPPSVTLAHLSKQHSTISSAMWAQSFITFPSVRVSWSLWAYRKLFAMNGSEWSTESWAKTCHSCVKKTTNKNRWRRTTWTSTSLLSHQHEWSW